MFCHCPFIFLDVHQTTVFPIMIIPRISLEVREKEVDSAVSELAIVVPDPRVELNEAVVVQVAVVSTLEDVVVGVGCG